MYIIRKCVHILTSICDPTISYYFLTRKTKNCVFAIFLQIYRLLFATSENFTFFSHGLLFWIKLCFNKNWKTICRGGWRPHPPLQIFFHPPLQIFFHSSLGYSFKSAIILNNIIKSWNFYHTHILKFETWEK